MVTENDDRRELRTERGFMVSIKEVAKHAGVAISTVSKVLNGYPNVSEETKKRYRTPSRS